MKSRDAIFFSISQLGIADLEIFFRSLKSAGVTAHIVCFAGDTDQATLEWLRAKNVEVVPMKEYLVTLPFLSRKLNLMKWFFPIMNLLWKLFYRQQNSSDILHGRAYNFVKRFSRICTMRFYYYYEFLVSHRAEYDRVVLTDVRDVVFQKDVFGVSWDENLHCFLEADGHPISSDKWNAYWIEKIGGASLLQKLGSCTISCAGVTFGATPVMLRYLQSMCEHLSSTIDRLDLDQGFHNVLIWTKELDAITLGQCAQSEVLTMGLMADEAIRCDEQGRILNNDGSLVSIVHQYDRKPAIATKLLKAIAADTNLS